MNAKIAYGMRLLFVMVMVTVFGAANVCADDFPDAAGDAAIAEKYLEWAEDAIGEGRWPQARAALERAMDFADVSSDIPYLLALARSHENENRGLVLQVLEWAIAIGQWDHYTEAQARLLAADQLIALRRYTAALQTLAVYTTIAGEDADGALLRLAALKGLVTVAADSSGAPSADEFRRALRETMNRYPRDPRPLRILFDYALFLKNAAHALDAEDGALLEIAARRLPFVIESDPELAWMAASFMDNTVEARRLVAAYRAGSFLTRMGGDFEPNPASIALALNYGLLDDSAATDELFEYTILDRDCIIETGNMLRGGEGRDYFARKLHSYTGVIIEDRDHDGYAESRAVYRQGNLQEYYADMDQDGITDVYIAFIAGTPQQAELTALPTRGEGRAPIGVFWERYPSVQRVEWGNETYLLAPGEFQFAPIIFEELGASDTYAGLLFPRVNLRTEGITGRMLMARAVSLQRPSAEFEGGVERIFLEQGTPLRAEVTLNGMVVSVTEFEDGYPLIQRLDMDLDGYSETTRRFNRDNQESSESDWYGNGLFTSAELYHDDGSVVYFWDLDGDGTREYEQRK